MTTSKESILNLIKEIFPNSYPEISKNDLINKNLFSPFEVELPEKVYEQIKTFSHELFKIKESEPYQKQISPQREIENWPKTPSLFTCLDFHYTQETGLKLIEINTNASLFLPFCLMRFGDEALNSKPMDELLQSFETTFNSKEGISILDFDPKKEGLYFEFLILAEWLEQNGHPSNIISLDQYSESAFFNVYNRYTDFYFERDSSEKLLEDYQTKQRLFSPNPREYYLLADKKRLELLREHFKDHSPSLAAMIPQTLMFEDFQCADELWENRKKYFFKPSQSFGSKGAFRGKSVSRKAFDNFYDPKFVAQEYCPPGKITFTHNEEEITMKYDLRFYVFNGKIQNYGARLYQGQTTNMRTTNGGLAPINFS